MLYIGAPMETSVGLIRHPTLDFELIGRTLIDGYARDRHTRRNFGWR